MAANPDYADVRRSSGCASALQEVKKARPTSVLLQMFADAKLDDDYRDLFESDHTKRQEGL